MGNKPSANISSDSKSSNEKLKSHLPFINSNVASVIAQYLSYKDLLNLGLATKQLNFLFLHNDKILKNEIQHLQGILLNYEMEVHGDVKNLSEFIIRNKFLHQQKKNPENEDSLPTQGYIAIKLNSEKSIDLIFSAHPITFDWRGDPTYWPVSENKKSLFTHPIPHLLSVCWFRMNMDFKIKTEPVYDVYIRMAGDNNFNIKDVDFVLDYKDPLLRDNKPLIKTCFNQDITTKFIKLKGEFELWLMGSINLKHIKTKEVELHFSTTERSGWWKSGWWLDAFIFHPKKA